MCLSMPHTPIPYVPQKHSSPPLPSPPLPSPFHATHLHSALPACPGCADTVMVASAYRHTAMLHLLYLLHRPHLLHLLHLLPTTTTQEALGAACGCPLAHLPAHTTTWPGLDDAVAALLEAAPDLLAAAALGSTSVQASSHPTQPCCSPGDAVQAAVQLAGIQAMERLLVRGEGLQAGWGADGGGGSGAVARLEAVSCVAHMCGHSSVRASALYYLWSSVLSLGRSCSGDGSSAGTASPDGLVDGVGQVVARALLDAAGGEQVEGR